MKKFLGSALALALPAAMMATAIVPVEETPGRVNGPVKLQRTASLKPFQKASERNDIFFEGFEGRPEGITMTSREWLPDGWQDVSKTGKTPTSSGHNLTWQVLDEDSKQTIGPVVYASAYDGYCFAYIMADVAYGDHTADKLENQDEWLITPSVTPRADDWFYFRLWFNPGWTVYNRDADNFTGQNNSLEVYVSEDDGVTWTKRWSLIDDYIKTHYSDSQLRTALITTDCGYEGIFINIHDLAGKPLKFAFRYFGRLGLPVAIDGVAVGVPQPDASFTVPYEALKQGLSPNIDYPVDPKLYIPFGREITWDNTSRDYLRNEWTYTDANGATATSALKDLVTPAYAFNSIVATPSLTSFFETSQTDPFQPGHAKMQAGGILNGKDAGGYEGEFGVGFYDITEKDHSIRISSEYIGFNPEIDLAYEKIQGMPDGAVDVAGICNVYYFGGATYGFDFIDVVALIKEKFDDNAVMACEVYSMDEEGVITGLIGKSEIKGSEMPEANINNYVNLRFKFDVPVMVESDIIVRLTNPCRDAEGNNVYQGNIVFPYFKSQSTLGNTLVYEFVSDSLVGEYDGFYNLNHFQLDGGVFGGILMNLGASYSSMELVEDKSITFPAEGGEETLKIKASHKPERWALTFDGQTRPEWISHTATYNEATQTYDVNLTAGANASEAIANRQLIIVSPGSFVAVDFAQESGIGSIEGDAAKANVRLMGNDIVVDGATRFVNIYTPAGLLVASTQASAGQTTLSTAGLSNGVYLVNVDGVSTVKIVK